MRAPVMLIIVSLLLIATGRPKPQAFEPCKGRSGGTGGRQRLSRWRDPRGAQGRVVFALDVDTEGRVTACTIETSSGYPILDATTCRIMTARARFVPAQDRKGRPAVDRVHGAIRWVLPQPEQAAGRSNHATADLGALVSDFDYPDEAIRAGAQGIVKFILDVAVDGRVTACTIEASSGFPVLDQTTCQIMTARARFVPAHDSAGRPVTDRLHAAIRWVIPQAKEDSGNPGDATAI